MPNRKSQSFIVNWPANSAVSDPVFLGGGCFGTLIVPSSLNNSTVNVVVELDDTKFGANLKQGMATPADFDNINLLSANKTLTTGANAFTTDEIRQMGAVSVVRFVLNNAPSVITQALLFWKD